MSLNCMYCYDVYREMFTRIVNQFCYVIQSDIAGIESVCDGLLMFHEHTVKRKFCLCCTALFQMVL